MDADEGGTREGDVGDNVRWICAGRWFDTDQLTPTIDEFEDGEYRVWCCPECGEVMKIERV